MFFYIISTLIFAFMFIFWSKGSLLNVIIKMIFGAMMVWGVILIAQTSLSDVNPQIGNTSMRLF